MAANSYTAKQLEALKAFDREPRRSFQAEGGPVIYLSDLIDLALRGLPKREDLLQAYEKGFADAKESAAMLCENAYGYMTHYDTANGIRALNRPPATGIPQEKT